MGANIFLTMFDLKLWKDDPYLEPYKEVIFKRFEQRMKKVSAMKNTEGSLADGINGYLYYGLQRYPDAWVLREWAPHASALYLLGDFNGWKPCARYAFSPADGGNWELRLPASALAHGDLYKLLVEWPGGRGERLPAYARRCVQDGQTKLFCAQVWCPPKPYRWRYKQVPRVRYPLIYEAHVGMSSEEGRVATFDEFRLKVLPRILRSGYNTLQLMAIQEHPYYGSFGYQVANLYAVSSRFGTPEDLKKLIDAAHAGGMAVVLDLVHSHSVKNELEGLSRFDGSYDQYFYAGARGEHPVWSSRCFDYGKDEVLHFLLSNCKYWLEEFRFDGFRFDGITSMLYCDHGIGRNFTNYSMYYDGNQDENAIRYLSIANELIHEVNPRAITIAEDISGMPGLAYPLQEGGMGFDFRMSMGSADLWQHLVNKVPDEQWQMGDIYFELTNKRRDEHSISYAECHDQAMVGDKTIIFSLIDKQMYTDMSKDTPSLPVDRGIALHKMIRLLTLATAGDGYLNFMGNEFGHPEWIDFPREGNGWSFKYARRQWSLVDNPRLRYQGLAFFDRDMIAVAKKYGIFASRPRILCRDNASQVLAFERAGLVFVFNFNPNNSFTSYGICAPAGKYRCLLDSDAVIYGGFERNRPGQEHFTVCGEEPEGGNNRLYLYLPARTAMVLAQ